MSTYPLIYRWSNRFIPLSEQTAEREIKRYQKQWNNKVKGFSGILREVFTNRPSTKINRDALLMSNQTNEALTNNSNNSVRFGFWTSEIVIIHEDENIIKEASVLIQRYLVDRGFKCLEESVNAMDAWLGTIPGHGSCNVRRLFIDSLNLSHVLPIHSIWAGAPYSSTSSLLPPYSPPVFYAATTGKTPFRFNLDVSDVGHQIVLGPTGSGKSTYLGFLIAQFLRYENAQIYVFDKDYSHKALTYALDGLHYDIGNVENLSFCPLADLSTLSKRIRAEQLIENLVELQNVVITPDIRAAIHNAILSMSQDKNHNSRSITVFSATVQHEDVRSALQYYTLKGQMPLLDALEDNIQTGYLQTFEMNWLLSQKPEIYIPILFYIFGQIESRLEEFNAKHPTLIILEEAWLYINHKLFAYKLKDWLKTLRKFNARVVFATQSLSDTYDPTTQTLTSVTATIMESCPTKIYLPNPTMESEVQNLYKKMGLNDRQLAIIKKISIPKKHYYVVTPEGNRLIELGFNDKYTMALAFIGLSKEKSNNLIKLKEKYQKDWVYYYLLENGNESWANYWHENYMKEAS
jgi:type IV secretion system protein VirB4